MSYETTNTIDTYTVGSGYIGNGFDAGYTCILEADGSRTHLLAGIMGSADNTRILEFDISAGSSATPSYLDESPGLGGYLAQFEATGNRIYVACTDAAGIQVLSLSGPGLSIVATYGMTEMRNKKMDAAASRELAGIEGMLLALDLTGADRALAALEQEEASSRPACVTPRDLAAVTCVLCGRTVPGDLGLCPYCGWDPKAASAECPGCGSPVLLSFRSCPSCGKGLPQGDQKRMVLSSLNLG